MFNFKKIIEAYMSDEKKIRKKEKDELEERIKELEKRMEKFENKSEDEFHFLNNPPKFKKGDKVKYIEPIENLIYTIIDVRRNSKERFFFQGNYSYEIISEDYVKREIGERRIKHV